MLKFGVPSRAAIAVALLFILTPFSTLSALDLSIGIDPDTGAISISGWSRRAADTGTIFYTCEQDACGKGSIISMRKQQQAVALDAEAMRRNEMRLSDTIRERAQGKIARIDIGEPIVSKDGIYSTGELTRTIIAADGAGPSLGISPYWKSGYVLAPAGMHTLVSSSNSRRNCDENYNTFKFALMLANVRAK